MVIPMSMRSHPPMTLPEYERMFRVIHAVVANEGADPSRASLFFAVAGAFMLRRHHRLETACPVAGVAAYNLPEPANALIIPGAVDGERLVSDEDHFHCWIESDGWIIDLTAPLFDAMIASGQQRVPVPPFMFQKPALPAAGGEKVMAPGAYLHLPNNRLTTALMNGFTEKAAYADLVRICQAWYARPPKKMAPSIGIESQDGGARAVPLSSIRLQGAW